MCLVPILQALAEAFGVNKTIAEVDLSSNKFGDEGVKARAPQRGPRLGGGTVERWDSAGTAVRQRCCMKHDALGAFLTL